MNISTTKKNRYITCKSDKNTQRGTRTRSLKISEPIVKLAHCLEVLRATGWLLATANDICGRECYCLPIAPAGLI